MMMSWFGRLFVVHNKIRTASHQSMALGSDRFKQEVQELTGNRVRPLKRGPKPKDHIME